MFSSFNLELIIDGNLKVMLLFVRLNLIEGYSQYLMGCELSYIAWSTTRKEPAGYFKND